jgi:hypothetical protein
MPIKSPPRLNVEISLRQSERADQLLPYGTRKIVVSKLLDALLDIVEKDPVVIGAIVSGAIGIKLEVRDGESSKHTE